MNVYFHINLDSNTTIEEFALDALDDYERYGLAEKEYFEGMLTLACDGNPNINISDELEPWIQNLCFNAVVKVLAGESMEILYFSKSGRLLLEPENGYVRITGDRISAALMPKDALAKALFDCGNRFISFVKSVKSDDNWYMKIVEDLEDLAFKTRTALISAGILDNE